MTMPLPYYIVDAFASQPFSGNPAAVVILDHARPDGWLQQVAAEFNLSETAFVIHHHDNHYNLRWFTPETEVDLCGHATLATSLALWEGEMKREGHHVSDGSLHFHTLSGELVTQRDGDTIVLDFPLRPTTPRNDLDSIRATFSEYAIAVADAAQCLLVEFAEEDQVRQFQADFDLIKRLSDFAVIITARAEKTAKVDFVSRFFAPNKGINEDPVTGAAHCALADYWSKKLNKTSLRAEQCSARGGLLGLRIQEPGPRDRRVHISGQGKLVMQGRLLV